MTISSTVRKAGPFDGTGSQTEFPFEFKVFSAGDLYVVQYNETTGVETVLELDSDYTVTLNADQDNDPGGTIELTSALAVNYTLTITSSLANLQPTDLTNRGGFYPSVINDALDRACIQIQQLQDETDRTLKTAVSVPDGVDNTLPMPAANMVIGWDNTGVALKNWSVNDLVTSVAYGSAKADIFTGDGETVDFYLELDPASINNLDVSVGGVCQVPVDDYTWTSGTKVTFTVAPPDGETVLIRYMQALPTGTVTWANVYDAPFIDKYVYINQDTTVTTAVNVLEGGMFIISAGKTLTINGPFSCGLFQCFDGAGSVVFGNGAVDSVKLEWFGGDNTGVTDASPAAIAAVASFATKGTITIDKQSAFTFMSSVAIGNKDISISGGGTIKAGDDIALFTVTAGNISIDGMTLTAATPGTGTAVIGNVDESGNYSTGTFTRNNIASMKAGFVNEWTASLFSENDIYLLPASSSGGYGVHFAGERNRVLGNKFYGGRHHVYISGATGIATDYNIVSNNVCRGCGFGAIQIYAYDYQDGCRYNEVNNNYVPIKVAGDVYYNKIIGNQIVQFDHLPSGYGAIDIEGGTVSPTNNVPAYNIIENNTITTATANLTANPAIRLQITEYNTVKGNIFNRPSTDTSTTTLGVSIPSTALSVNNIIDGNVFNYCGVNIGASSINTKVINNCFTPVSGSVPIITGDLYYAIIENNSLGANSTYESPANVTSFSVGTARYVTTKNTAPTSVAAMTNGYPGQLITIFIRDAYTTLKQGNFRLAGGVDFVGTDLDTITLVKLYGFC